MLALPMGWSWALYFCQAALCGFVRLGNTPASDAMRDHEPTKPLSSKHTTHIEYVDNFAGFSLVQQTATASVERTAAAATQAGLVCHPVEEGAEQELLGVHWSGRVGRVSITPKRLWKLRFGILHALKIGALSGEQMRRLIGHASFAALLRRCSLRALSSVYAFVEQCGTTVTPPYGLECGASCAGLPRSFRSCLTMYGQNGIRECTPPMPALKGMASVTATWTPTGLLHMVGWLRPGIFARRMPLPPEPTLLGAIPSVACTRPTDSGPRPRQ